VTAAEGRQIEVELAQHARMLPAVELAVGAVLHPDELAVDKTLALFGRAEARDLVAVNALAGRNSRERLLELAVTKDPGFDTAVFADALGVACRKLGAGVRGPGRRRTRLGPAVGLRNGLAVRADDRPGYGGTRRPAGGGLRRDRRRHRPDQAARRGPGHRLRAEPATASGVGGPGRTGRPAVVSQALNLRCWHQTPSASGGGERRVGADRAPPRGEHLGRAATPALPHTVRSTLSGRGNGPGDTSGGAWKALVSAPFGWRYTE